MYDCRHDIHTRLMYSYRMKNLRVYRAYVGALSIYLSSVTGRSGPTRRTRAIARNVALQPKLQRHTNDRSLPRWYRVVPDVAVRVRSRTDAFFDPGLS